MLSLFISEDDEPSESATPSFSTLKKNKSVTSPQVEAARGMLTASMDYNKQKLDFLKLQHQTIMDYWTEKRRLLSVEEKFLELEHAAKMSYIKDKINK